MRAPRALTTMAVTASLLAIPALSAAQSAGPAEDVPIPLARQPADRLPLEGTPWRLESYHYRDREGVPGPEIAAFASFQTSSLEGSGGCFKVRGQYGAVGSTLEIKLRPVDGRACTEQTALVQEAVENGLRKAASYEVEPGATSVDDKLVIRAASGEEVLRYGLDDVAGLDWGEWRLTGYTADGQPVGASAEQPAVITFRPEEEAFFKRRQSGPFSGSTGCNGLVATFYRQADVLSFSEIERTDAPCTPQLAAQEAAMAAVLDSTSVSIDLPYDRLVLTSEDTGERLEFASQVPVEGSTWLLSGKIDGQRPEARVTLRLEDGVASGEGPCGAFSASYVTDGVFITFRDVQGARDSDCAELKAEKALLDGLRSSVRVERTPERLRFKDARATTTLRFGRPFAP